MVVGAFFTEVGNFLLAYFSTHDPQQKHLSAELKFDGKGDDSKFEQLKSNLKSYTFSVHTNENILRNVDEITSK